MIGIIGGSGFYSLLENAREVEVTTPWGAPSDKIFVGAFEGKEVAFLPRHGLNHQFPPHKVPYRANIAALKQLGCKYIFGPCACGSLQKNVKPGDFVILDQFVDRTRGRVDSFYDNGPSVAHISTAHPYCPVLRAQAVEAARRLGITVHEKGTVVIIQGPRFSTKSESRWFSAQGWEVINMTQYPESPLAREAEVCYVGIALITDYDAGLEEEGIPPVTNDEVMRVFKENLDKVKRMLLEMIRVTDTSRACECHTAMAHAVLSGGKVI